MGHTLKNVGMMPNSWTDCEQIWHTYADPFACEWTWVVLRKRAPKCDIELFALDLHVLVANRLVQCATYTV